MTFIASRHNIDPRITPILRKSATVDLIFLKTTGNWYESTVDGSDVDIDLPTRAVDDDLFVLVQSSFQEALLPAGWTQRQSHTVASIIGAVQLFHRLATNTAADNFHMPVISSTRNRIAQMAVFGKTIAGAPPDAIVQIQSGGIFNTAGTTLSYFTMAAGSDPTETLVIFIASHFRLNNTLNAVSITPNTDTDISAGFNFAPIGSFSANDAVLTRNQATWSWDYHDTSVAVPAGAITYTDVEFGANFSQYSRWNYQ